MGLKRHSRSPLLPIPYTTTHIFLASSRCKKRCRKSILSPLPSVGCSLLTRSNTKAESLRYVAVWERWPVRASSTARSWHARTLSRWDLAWSSRTTKCWVVLATQTSVLCSSARPYHCVLVMSAMSEECATSNYTTSVSVPVQVYRKRIIFQRDRAYNITSANLSLAMVGVEWQQKA